VRFIFFIFVFHTVFFSFAHWRFVFSKILRTVYGMFFVCFWVVLSYSFFVQKNLNLTNLIT